MDATYRKAYQRGWSAGVRGADGALERADDRHDPESWYDGYLDAAAGRERYHIPNCPDHNTCGIAL